jgi:hypothetical protein
MAKCVEPKGLLPSLSEHRTMNFFGPSLELSPNLGDGLIGQAAATLG